MVHRHGSVSVDICEVDLGAVSELGGIKVLAELVVEMASVVATDVVVG